VANTGAAKWVQIYEKTEGGGRQAQGKQKRRKKRKTFAIIARTSDDLLPAIFHSLSINPAYHFKPQLAKSVQIPSCMFAPSLLGFS
jgi:hypothetical protein